MSPTAGVILLINLAVILFVVIGAAKNETGEAAEGTAWLTILLFVVIGAIDVISLIVWAIRAIFKL